MVAIVDVKDGSFLIRCTQRDSWDGDNELFSSLAWFIFSIPFIHVTLSRALLELHYTSWTSAWCERTFIYICKPASLHSGAIIMLWTWVKNNHNIYIYIKQLRTYLYISLNSDIPKSSALQSCKFPVAKYQGVIHKFNHKFDTLTSISIYQFAVLHCLQNFRLAAAIFRFFVNRSYWVKSPLEGF